MAVNGNVEVGSFTLLTSVSKISNPSGDLILTSSTGRVIVSGSSVGFATLTQLFPGVDGQLIICSSTGTVSNNVGIVFGSLTATNAPWIAANTGLLGSVGSVVNGFTFGLNGGGGYSPLLADAYITLAQTGKASFVNGNAGYGYGPGFSDTSHTTLYSNGTASLNIDSNNTVWMTGSVNVTGSVNISGNLNLSVNSPSGVTAPGFLLNKADGALRIGTSNNGLAIGSSNCNVGSVNGTVSIFTLNKAAIGIDTSQNIWFTASLNVSGNINLSSSAQISVGPGLGILRATGSTDGQIQILNHDLSNTPGTTGILIGPKSTSGILVTSQIGVGGRLAARFGDNSGYAAFVGASLIYTQFAGTNGTITDVNGHNGLFLNNQTFNISSGPGGTSNVLAGDVSGNIYFGAGSVNVSGTIILSSSVTPPAPLPGTAVLWLSSSGHLFFSSSVVAATQIA